MRLAEPVRDGVPELRPAERLPRDDEPLLGRMMGRELRRDDPDRLEAAGRPRPRELWPDRPTEARDPDREDRRDALADAPRRRALLPDERRRIVGRADRDRCDLPTDREWEPRDERRSGGPPIAVAATSPKAASQTVTAPAILTRRLEFMAGTSLEGTQTIRFAGPHAASLITAR
ncbi:MAG: hypothetical protein ACYSUI_17865 [Planctomycetota bacterium]|jgi:hypothetical protein